MTSSHKVAHRDAHKMNNTSEKELTSCLYSQEYILKSALYKDAVLPVILPLSVLTSCKYI